MKIQTRLLLAGLLACGTATTTRAAGNLVVDTGGQMHVELELPYADDADRVVPVTMGRVELAPVQFMPHFGARFWLTRMSLSFGDFSIDRLVYGDHSFTSVGVDLDGAVSFWGIEAPAGVYTFLIPHDYFTAYGVARDNGEINAGTQHPLEDVTGTIDLNANTFSAQAVFLKHRTIAYHDVTGRFTITLTGKIAPPADTDGDGVPDVRDNCVLTRNPRQDLIASPVITAPPSLYAYSCDVLSFGTVTGVDVCSAQPVVVANDAPPKFGEGTTLVTWMGQTAVGAVGTAVQSVEVVDKTRPVFLSVPKAITFSECDPVDIGLAMALDDCDFGTPHVTNDAPPHFPLGPTVVTWKATDRAGNLTTAKQVVTVTKCN
jgi:hypothetical protein